MIWAGKVLVNEGPGRFHARPHLVPAAGQPSLFLMKCHSVGFDEITPENILTIDLDGKVVAGTRAATARSTSIRRSSRRAPDVHCVLHTHPPYSIACRAPAGR